MNIVEEYLIDPYDPDYHYIATFNDLSYDDDESLEKTTATVKFKAYPYKITNKPKEYVFIVPANGEIEATIFNDSAHRLTPTFICDVALNVKIGDTNYSIPAGEITDGVLKLAVGGNTFKISSVAETGGNLTVRFNEELF